MAKATIKAPSSEEVGWRPQQLIGGIAQLVAVVVAWTFLWGRPRNCLQLQPATAFAGSVARFEDYHTHHAGCQLTSLGGARWLFVAGALLGVISAIVIARQLETWWDRAWLAPSLRASKRRVLALPYVTAVFSVMTNLLGLVGVRFVGTQLSIRGWVAPVVPLFAWPNVLSFGVTAFALILTWFAAIGRKRLPQTEPDLGRVWTPSRRVESVGICCSGGGIRAGSIALGALSVLERHDLDGAPLAAEHLNGTNSILDQSRYLASVSGGGYTAGAWRVARGTVDEPLDPELWPSGIIGDPDEYRDIPPTDFDSRTRPGSPSLYRHLQARRQFLRTGRGGLPLSLIYALAALALQLLLLAATVVLIAWPMGRLSRSWFIYGGIGCQRNTAAVVVDAPTTRHDLSGPICPNPNATESTAVSRCSALAPDDPFLRHSLSRTRCFLSNTKRDMVLTPSLLGPPIALGLLAVVTYCSRLWMWRTSRRRALSSVAAGLAGAASVFAMMLLGVPLLLDIVYPSIGNHASVGGLAAIGSFSGAAAVAIQLARRLVSKRLVVLGGVLLGAVVVLFGIVVAGEAATGRGWFGLGPHLPLAGYVLYLGLVIGLLVAYCFFDPRLWSLHIVYRDRLRQGFATTRDKTQSSSKVPDRIIVERGPDGVDRPAGWERAQDRLWPFRHGRAPTLDQYDCAAGPEHLVCCAVARRARTATGVAALSFVMGPGEVVFYEPFYSGNDLQVHEYAAPTGRLMSALGRSASAEGTVLAAAAMSGAAIAPSMGRFNLGSTNALIAALNLRLGVWLPNPRYLCETVDHYPRSRLVYLLKEIIGYFTLEDHHVYVTDGGHRENLGLVELLRRRCRFIICIDGSGDLPGSFATLRQAAELARTETCADLDLSQLPARGAAGVPQSAYVVIPVRYTEQPDVEANILHIRSEMYQRVPIDLQAFGAEDQNFPHYSTGDQLLSEAQFRHLVLFGKHATLDALADPKVRELIRDALSTRPHDDLLPQTDANLTTRLTESASTSTT